MRPPSATPCIASAGTHPFSRYEHQEVTDRPRYRELIADMGWVAERELIFGLHVHVGLASPAECDRVHERDPRPSFPSCSPSLRTRPSGRRARPVSLRRARRSSRPSRAPACRPPSPRGRSSSCSSSAASGRTPSRTTRTSGGTCGRIRASGRSSCGSATRRPRSRPSRGSSRSPRASSRRSPRTSRPGEPLPVQPVTLVDENKWRATRDGLDAQADRPRARHRAPGP